MNDENPLTEDDLVRLHSVFTWGYAAAMIVVAACIVVVIIFG